MKAEGEQYESQHLLLLGAPTMGREGQMPETLWAQDDVLIEKWAVNQGLCGINSVRGLFFAPVILIVHCG
jgi:hypothetical protein